MSVNRKSIFFCVFTQWIFLLLFSVASFILTDSYVLHMSEQLSMQSSSSASEANISFWLNMCCTDFRQFVILMLAVKYARNNKKSMYDYIILQCFYFDSTYKTTKIFDVMTTISTWNSTPNRRKQKHRANSLKIHLTHRNLSISNFEVRSSWNMRFFLLFFDIKTKSRDC